MDVFVSLFKYIFKSAFYKTTDVCNEHINIYARVRMVYITKTY